MNRRNALKWITGSAAGAVVATPLAAAPGETAPAPMDWTTRHPIHDPDFSKPLSGPWPRVMTESELRLTKVLADLILPKDDNGPAASEVGIPEFINEWISAPYDEQREDGEVVRGGLAWLSTQSFKSFGKAFDEATTGQQTELLDSIADASKAKPEDAIGVAFFKKFRQLVVGGYYSHSATWKHLGYTGNVTLAGAYPGVPDEVIKKLGLEEVA